jgi:glyoxylase-like metal-dependent hydrolase (beta-lactamase superfamily II)
MPISFARRLPPLTVAALLSAGSVAFAQRDFSKVEIEIERVADGVHVLQGAGGNIGVCSGADGIFLVDDQYAPLTEKIRAAVAEISERPIRFVLNTHWHGDHTGGNENLAGAGVLVVAHDNVRRRMGAEQLTALGQKVPPSPAAALPVVTFSDTVTFHLNGDEIVALHAEHAHTDGDALVFWRRANVVHMGDCFWNGFYPYIDVASGGSIDGLIAAADVVLGRVDAATRIVPGHGPVGDRAALQTYRDMLVRVRDRVRALAGEGKTLSEIQAAKPTSPWDATWGTGFIKPDKFVDLVHAGVAKR